MANNVLEFLQHLYNDLVTKDYDKDDVNRTAEQRVKDKADNLADYVSIIALGMTSLFWNDTTAMLQEVHGRCPKCAYGLALYFSWALLSMVMGVIASTFPARAVWHMGFAGNGALQGLIFILASFHLETFVYHPDWVYAVICLAATVLALVLYWCSTIQDPLWLHLLVKFVLWILMWALWILWQIVLRLFWFFVSILSFLYSIIRSLCEHVANCARSLGECFVAALARPPSRENLLDGVYLL